MISKQQKLFFFVGDKPFNTLKEAQLHDLAVMAEPLAANSDVAKRAEAPRVIADWMLENAAQIVDTLTTTPTSRAKARKTNGAKRTRKRPVLAPATIPEGRT